MIDLSDGLTLYILAVISFGLYLFFYLVLNKKISGVIDPLNISLIYLSFSIVGLFFSLVRDGLSLYSFYLLILWVAVFLVVNSIHAPIKQFCQLAVKVNAGEKKEVIDVFSFAIVVFIYLMYSFILVSSIVKNGMLTNIAGAIDSRFSLFSENRLFFNFYNSISFLPAVFFYRLNRRLDNKMFFLFLAPFWFVQLLTFSKTAFLFPILEFAIYKSMQFCDDEGHRKKSIVSLFMSLAASFLFVYSVFFVIGSFLTTSGDVVDPLTILFQRLLTGYDALYNYAHIYETDPHSLSLVQFYLAPVYKLFGFFSQKYNAANFFLAVNYYGYDYDYAGMLPNNNNILEVLITSEPLLGPIVVLFISAIYSIFYLVSRNLVTSKNKVSSLLIFPVGYIFSTPLSFLVDGQGWFGGIIYTIILSLFLFFVASLRSIFKGVLKI